MAKLDAAPFDDEELPAVKKAGSGPGISWSEQCFRHSRYPTSRSRVSMGGVA